MWLSHIRRSTRIDFNITKSKHTKQTRQKTGTQIVTCVLTCLFPKNCKSLNVLKTREMRFSWRWQWRTLFSKSWRRGVFWHLATFRGNIMGLSLGINIEAAGYFETKGHLTSKESKYLCPSQYDVVLSNDIYNVEADTSQSVEWHATGWLVRDSNPGGSKISSLFLARTDPPWDPHSLLPSGKAATPVYCLR